MQNWPCIKLVRYVCHARLKRIYIIQIKQKPTILYTDVCVCENHPRYVLVPPAELRMTSGSVRKRQKEQRQNKNGNERTEANGEMKREIYERDRSGERGEKQRAISTRVIEDERVRERFRKRRRENDRGRKQIPEKNEKERCGREKTMKKKNKKKMEEQEQRRENYMRR